MNRIKCGVAVCTAALWATCSQLPAVTTLPGIKGTVYTDLDLDNTLEPGEALSGATVKLYQDDGDGIFEPGAGDLQTGPDLLSGLDGAYYFTSLPIGHSFFVHLPAQNAGGMSIPESVSGLIDPMSPTMIIDSFQGSQESSADTMAPIATSSSTFMPSQVIGGERDLYVELISGKGDVDMRVNKFNSEVYQYDTTSGVNGKGILTWDGMDGSGTEAPSMGLGGIDLTNGGADEGILMKLGVDAAGSGETAKLRIFQGDAASFSEAILAIPVTDGTASKSVVVPFTSFIGSVSPDQVDAIQLILGGTTTKSIDAQFDFIGTVGPRTHDFAVVPEPSSVALALCGCAAFLLRRRRA
jgi:hypothetical protein